MASVIEFVLTVSAMIVGLLLFGASSAALLQLTLGFQAEPLVWFIAMAGAAWLAYITRRTVRRRLGLDKPNN
ncbi:hypothetical protein [Nitrolancea hollandica]|uniref:Uncharacterized protein n=1 Tax=Nitrolancea hollandica Lb TaxID=1129897 RepID=I4ECJ1_9BACT|nr:hypothetical protein [Nitrolancea hollandica]CCF82403.1 exported hypothetical protein [Nitrolancea hollandica Lb]